MPANNRAGLVHFYAGRYPGSVGLLMSPEGWSVPPDYMPYAIDNGCFIKWEPDKFVLTLKRAGLCHKPMWVVVPDVVGNAELTMRMWQEWENYIFFPKAFACQDGMEPQDVPRNADCCFIGGTTDWKLANAHKFKGVTKWLHIGRVSTANRLTWAQQVGADSVDGTGFFRGDKAQLQALKDFIEGRKQQELPFSTA